MISISISLTPICPAHDQSKTGVLRQQARRQFPLAFHDLGLSLWGRRPVNDFIIIIIVLRRIIAGTALGKLAEFEAHYKRSAARPEKVGEAWKIKTKAYADRTAAALALGPNPGVKDTGKAPALERRLAALFR